MVLSKRTIFLLSSSFILGCASAPAPLHEAEPDTEVEDDPSPQGVIEPPTVLTDDHRVVVDAVNYASKRQAIIDFVWGAEGFPTRMPVVHADVAPPAANLSNVARVEELRIEMEGGETNFTQHIVAERSNGRLVVFALGHLCTVADATVDPTSDVGYGQFRTLDALLADGYSVLVTYMPHSNPRQCRDVDHNKLLTRTVATGHPVKWFLEPVAVSLNHLKQSVDGSPRYRDISMIGLSGGGWTTTLYAAIDPSIKTSIQIAGTVPLYLRAGSSIGDREQTLPPLYMIAGYPDLYVLSATGVGRRHVQVLNRRDNCCFGERSSQYSTLTHGPWDVAMRRVEAEVQARLATMGSEGGSFRLEIDEAPNHHTISWNTIVTTILGELNGGLRTVGAASGNHIFMRHDGAIWERTSGVWRNTSLRGVGTPAVVVRPDQEVDLFYRSTSNRLARAVRRPGGTWTESVVGPTLVTDPVAVRVGDQTILSAIGPSYDVLVARIADDQTQPVHLQLMGPRVAGPVAAVASGGDLRLYARGLDRNVHLLALLDVSTVTGGKSIPGHTTLGGPIVDFPAAIRAQDDSERVYYRNLDGLHELRSLAGGPWSAGEVTQSTMLMGSPAVSEHDGALHVHCRGPFGGVHTFELEDSAWSRGRIRAQLHDSLVAVDGLVFGTDVAGQLWQSDGVGIVYLGRP